ncbi:MAG: response regulator transcription factor [Phycisphaerales bacterium]
MAYRVLRRGRVLKVQLNRPSIAALGPMPGTPVAARAESERGVADWAVETFSPSSEGAMLSCSLNGNSLSHEHVCDPLAGEACPISRGEQRTMPPHCGSSSSVNSAMSRRGCGSTTFPFTETVWLHVALALRLAPQQSRIVELLLQGKRDKQIATELGLTIPTVRTYLARTFQRVGVADRVELILRVFAVAEQLRREGCTCPDCPRSRCHQS